MPDDYLEFDLGDLTIGEIEEIEELLDRPFTGLMEDGKPMGKTLRAIGYIARKRTDPTFTFEDAKKLKLKVTATTDPTQAGG